MFETAGQEVVGPVPAGHLLGADLCGQRAPGVPPHRLLEVDVQVVEEAAPAVAGDQVGEHRAVAVGVEDALDDGVEAVVEGMLGH
ncbi:hypothetical protein [Kitasatospora cineracea]|uniref:hypothetical protein n=1 Tax=Kitasatospora cineracea TaxID=88074 RepID=UPI000F4EDDEC|nr:hypothetical protein [Kitasatospora cineracea]